MLTVLSVVVFLGVGGPNSARIDRQVAALLHRDADVERLEVPRARQRALARHAGNARALVEKMKVGGAVVGVVERTRRGATLRLLVYAGDGRMLELVELPIEGRALDRGDLDDLRETLVASVADLQESLARRKTKRARKRERVPEPEPEVDRAPRAPVDDEDPLSTATARDHRDGGDDDDDAGSADAELDADAELGFDPTPVLAMRASLGFGVTGRNFAPGPAAVAAYASNPVGAIRLDAGVRPTRRVALAFAVERTLGMSSQVGDDVAASAITHWQFRAGRAYGGARFELQPTVGVGRRSFVTESKDPTRSPDGDYTYALAGAELRAHLGRATLFGLAAFEPVVSGANPTEMTFGPVRRWAIEASAGLELEATRHTFVRARGDLQRFAWSWSQAGTRGAGGAADRYTGASLAVGVHY